MKNFIILQILFLPFFIFAEEEADCVKAKEQLEEVGIEYALAVAELYLLSDKIMLAWDQMQLAQNNLAEVDLQDPAKMDELVSAFRSASEEYDQLIEIHREKYIEKTSAEENLHAKARDYDSACFS